VGPGVEIFPKPIFEIEEEGEEALRLVFRDGDAPRHGAERQAEPLAFARGFLVLVDSLVEAEEVEKGAEGDHPRLTAAGRHGVAPLTGGVAVGDARED